VPTSLELDDSERLFLRESRLPERDRFLLRSLRAERLLDLRLLTFFSTFLLDCFSFSFKTTAAAFAFYSFSRCSLSYFSRCYLSLSSFSFCYFSFNYLSFCSFSLIYFSRYSRSFCSFSFSYASRSVRRIYLWSRLFLL
jgi:hypothetical protein